MATGILVYKATLSGGKPWVVDRAEGGKRKRSYFPSEKEANDKAKDLRDQIAKTGRVWFEMPASERHMLITIWHEAKQKGIDLWELVREKKKPISNGDGPALKTVVESLIARKKENNLSEDYRNNLEYLLGQFIEGREMLPIGRVTVADLEKWLASKALASRKTLRGRLSALFTFALQREYIKNNPVAALERLKVGKPPPQILKVDQVKACLEFLTTKHKASRYAPWICYRFALPWFVMSTFCGLRPEEAQQIERHEINFKEGWIKVEAHITKIRQRRVVYPKPEAMALLERSMGKGRFPLGDNGRKRIIYRLREHLGMKKWVRDLTRHTAASNWVADCQSVIDVATALGNSEPILRRDYLALVTKVEAEQFWALCSQFLIS
jgi:integrase